MTKTIYLVCLNDHVEVACTSYEKALVVLERYKEHETKLMEQTGRSNFNGHFHLRQIELWED